MSLRSKRARLHRQSEMGGNTKDKKVERPFIFLKSAMHAGAAQQETEKRALHVTLYLHNSRYVVLLCVTLMSVLAKQTYFSNLPMGN